MQNKLAILLFVAISCGISGCAGVKNSMRPSEKISRWNPLAHIKEDQPSKKKNAPSKPPETMAVIWKDTMLEKPGTAPVKGFGGRIYFYDADNTAVKTDGELIVYGFDDSDDSKPSKSSQADRKFVFPAEHLESHYSETDLGPSYSVWIPWEKMGGQRKTITLIPVFKSASGSVIKSGQSINVLPGKAPSTDNNATVVSTPKQRSLPAIQNVGFESEISDNQSMIQQAGMLESEEEIYNQPRIRTSTIRLTPGLANQMAAAGPTPLLPTKRTPQSPSKILPVDHQTVLKAESKTDPEKKSGDADQPKKETVIKSPAVFGTPGSFR